MAWRIIRRLLAMTIRLLIWRPVVSLSVIVIALGAVGLALGGSTGALPVPGATSSAVASTSPTTAPTPLAVQPAPTVTPVPAVDEYIKGMTTFNAQLMWDALDPGAIQAMTSQGGSEQALQQRLDDAKQNGAHYEGVAYVGGYPLQNGDRYLFYVVSRRGFAGRDVFDQVFFVFTVGPNGKILRID
ncbi:MAG TPA: hypothetical protein VKX96_16640 [Chloroflexota bacterium]|nr:hypothetical protein [Chloroflexota bacterium]